MSLVAPVNMEPNPQLYVPEQNMKPVQHPVEGEEDPFNKELNWVWNFQA